MIWIDWTIWKKHSVPIHSCNPIVRDWRAMSSPTRASAQLTSPHTTPLGDRPIIVSQPLQPRILWGLNKRRWATALTGNWNIPILYKHYITYPISCNWQLSTSYQSFVARSLYCLWFFDWTQRVNSTGSVFVTTMHESFKSLQAFAE